MRKKLLYAGLLCLIALAVWAANPSFSDFLGSQFATTSNNKIAIKASAAITNAALQFPLGLGHEDAIVPFNSSGISFQYRGVAGDFADVVWNTVNEQFHFPQAIPFYIDNASYLGASLAVDPVTGALVPISSATPVQNFYSTNVNIYDSLTIETNLIVKQNINVNGHATFNQFLVVSNGIQYASQAWANAPTGALNLNIGRQHFSISSGSVKVTGVTGKSTTNVQPVVIEFYNGTGSDQTLTMDPGFADANYSTQYTLTNGRVFAWSVEYTPFLSSGRTNSVGRGF